MRTLLAQTSECLWKGEMDLSNEVVKATGRFVQSCAAHPRQPAGIADTRSTSEGQYMHCCKPGKGCKEDFERTRTTVLALDNGTSLEGCFGYAADASRALVVHVSALDASDAAKLFVTGSFPFCDETEAGKM